MGNHDIIAVLLIDDASLLRETIQCFLQIQPDIELIATTNAVSNIAPLILQGQDVVILLGVRNGTWADIDCLRQLAPQIPIILMGLLEETSIKTLKVNNGANSYIDKSALIVDIVTEIKKLANSKKST